jgi:hypothetical protein
MESFNEYLGSLLVNCRDNALEELRSDQRYIKLKKAQDDLRAKLESIISPEAQTLLEEFLEAAVSVHGMGYNRVLLCGLTASAELQKRFDAYTPEYKAFADEFL